MRRVICLHLPDFVLSVHVRKAAREAPHGLASTDPIAVVTSGPENLTSLPQAGNRSTLQSRTSRSLFPGRGIVAVNKAAQKQGIRPGMSLIQAYAACCDLVTLSHDASEVVSEVHAITRQLRTLTPTVEAHPGWFFLEEHVTPASLGREERTGRDALRLLRRMGFLARGAIADERFTAAAIAQSTSCPLVVVPPGGSENALAPLPLSVLPLPKPMAHGLGLLGLKTLGDLARLTEADVAARWGKEGVLCHRLARGMDPTPLRASPSPEPLEETVDLDEPIESVEYLSPLLTRLAEILARRLQQRSQAATRLSLTVGLEGSPPSTCTLLPVRPLTTASSIVNLVMASLRDTTLSSRPTSLTLSVTDTVFMQKKSLSLFNGPTLNGETLDACLARLRSLLGAEGVHAVRRTDSYRPEAMAASIPFEFPETAGLQGHTPPPFHPVQALRLLDPPTPVELSEGPPPRIRWLGASRRIARVVGPLRVSGEWWRAPFARDYFELLLCDGTTLWIFRDEQGEIFVQGIGD